MQPLRFLASTAVVVAVSSDPAHAHGYISSPAASYANSYTKTSYNALLSESANAAFRGRKWNDSPEANARQFTEAFRASGEASLKALLDAAAPGCGNSRVDVAPVDVSGLGALQFRNDEYREGFVSSHHGPCEIWIDSTRVFHGDDCRAQFPSYPASIPVDYSACSPGKTCTLTFYWLALHEPQWQVYKQCVPITRRASLRRA
ncbi:hypothetical protein ATCC90586_006955 [Pythium insidiosum]|nr:hypothetical protein ATCC90586_006955 [Pythium insidiosum]